MLMSSRTLLAAILVSCCSCSAPEPDLGTEARPYALTITGPTGPFRGHAEVTATPEPADGTVEVRFEVDGDERAVDEMAPFAASIDMSPDWGGAHLIKAIARRQDGATAEASIEVTYDPLGPFVTMLKPALGTRVSPEGGKIDVAFLANDPSGLAGGEVKVGDGAPMSVPLSSLSLEVLVPKAVALPATPEVSWWFDDTVGNRTQGATTSVLQSYEVFSASLETAHVYPLPGRRLALLATSQLVAIEADGTPAWKLDGPLCEASTAVPAGGGDLLVMWSTVQGTTRIQRVKPDGTVAWTWSNEVTSPNRAVYVAEIDGLLIVQRLAIKEGFTALLLDQTGQTTNVKTFPEEREVWPFATPPGVSPGGFALGSAGPNEDVGHYEVFDIAGAPLWSADLSSIFLATMMLTRDAIFGPMPMAKQYSPTMVGPGGTIADIGICDVVVVAPNGDLVFSAGTTLTRLHPDGSVVWGVPLPSAPSIAGMAGDRIGVSTETSTYVIDGMGGVLEWVPDADTELPIAPRVVLDPSGKLRYVVATLANKNERVYRVAEDGATLWHETLFDPGGLSSETFATDDERLVVFTRVPAVRMHVFEP
ncbi:Hypothetical protein A7982_00268 [Minicystis rosea]|nr:Hypothetical protein A7982_00268 [Minicystis rosea]